MAAAAVSQVSTAIDSLERAENLARSAVSARLAACAQVLGPMLSTYRWQGTVEQADEWLVVFKTADDRADELQSYLVAHHSYDLPEVLRTPVIGGNPPYLAWIREQTRPAS